MCFSSGGYASSTAVSLLLALGSPNPAALVGAGVKRGQPLTLWEHQGLGGGGGGGPPLSPVVLQDHRARRALLLCSGWGKGNTGALAAIFFARVFLGR